MSKAKPRVALVHDRLCNRGGGEMIALAMAKHFQADVFTAKYKPENTFDYAQKLNVTEISPGKTYSSEVKDIFVRMKDALKFAALDLKEYDFVILSGTYAFFAAKKNPNNLLYCHSPNRFVYDLYYPYRREFSQSNFLKGVAFSAWKNFWEPIDQAHFRKVKNIVTNSRNVGLRVQRYYGR
ncbi:MAG TPA: hypothetical protein VJI67_02935, partial [archaeon]|nr:hypothetical protein [archaeon]